MYKDILLARIQTFENLMNEAQKAENFKIETDYYIKLGKCYAAIRAICQVVHEAEGISLPIGDDWSTMDIKELKGKVRLLK